MTMSAVLIVRPLIPDISFTRHTANTFTILSKILQAIRTKIEEKSNDVNQIFQTKMKPSLVSLFNLRSS